MTADRTVALATCREFADLEDDDRLLLAPLAARGVTPVPAVWDDPAVDWSAYDLVVLRSTWDYPPRRDEFLDWAARVPRLANPAPVVRWNTDKRYLADLTAAGLPTVPTTFLVPGESGDLPASGVYVLKPAVGAGSVDAGRYDLGDAGDRALAEALADRLLRAGRAVVVQPYLDAVDSHGETALMYLNGRLSHAVVKGALLDGPATDLDGLFKDERIEARAPSEAEKAVGEQVVAALPALTGLERTPLYARVDVVPDSAGAPVVLEVELTEPSLFMTYAPESAERFADAISAALSG